MNLEAAVLGSDSAVTMFDSSGRPFNQSGVEKIFVINERAPVAAMVYGGGAFAGYPWKTVLGDFARNCGDRPLPMSGYTESLLSYLSAFGADGELKLDPELERELFSLYLCAFLLDYRLWLEILGWKAGMPVTAHQAQSALTVYSRKVLYLDPESEDQEQLTPRPHAETGARLKGFITETFATAMAREMGRVFAGSPFPESELPALAKLAIQSLAVEWLPAHLNFFTTGLVMAGFGAGAPVPSMVAMEFFGPFGGIVKYSGVQTRTPRPADPVLVETFALADLTQAFLHGAMPGYEDTAFRVTAHLLSGMIGDILNEASAVSKPLAAKLHAKLQDVPYAFPNIAAHLARRVRHTEVREKLWPQLSAANAVMLGNFAHKFMTIPILEHELLREGGVGRPIVVLTMNKGGCTFVREGEA